MDAWSIITIKIEAVVWQDDHIIQLSKYQIELNVTAEKNKAPENAERSHER